MPPVFCTSLCGCGVGGLEAVDERVVVFLVWRRCKFFSVKKPLLINCFNGLWRF